MTRSGLTVEAENLLGLREKSWRWYRARRQRGSKPTSRRCCTSRLRLRVMNCARRERDSSRRSISMRVSAAVAADSWLRMRPKTGSLLK